MAGSVREGSGWGISSGAGCVRWGSVAAVSCCAGAAVLASGDGSGIGLRGGVTQYYQRWTHEPTNRATQHQLGAGFSSGMHSRLSGTALPLPATIISAETSLKSPS